MVPSPEFKEEKYLCFEWNRNNDYTLMLKKKSTLIDSLKSLKAMHHTPACGCNAHITDIMEENNIPNVRAPTKINSIMNLVKYWLNRKGQALKLIFKANDISSNKHQIIL